jgi:hypothetical protein
MHVGVLSEWIGRSEGQQPKAKLARTLDERWSRDQTQMTRRVQVRPPGAEHAELQGADVRRPYRHYATWFNASRGSGEHLGWILEVLE